MLGNCVRMALRELRANLMRTGLTTLGIVIGVAAVVIVVTITQGVTNQVLADIASRGQNLIMLEMRASRSGPVSRATPFRLADAEAVEREIGGLSGVAPSVGTQLLFTAGDRNYMTGIYASTVPYMRLRNWEVAYGRAFSEGEVRRGAAVCVLGETVRVQLFGHQNPVGAAVRSGSFSCRVIGVLKKKEHSVLTNDVNDGILMPITTFHKRLAGHNIVSTIWAGVANAHDVERAKAAISTLMRERRKLREGERENFRVSDERETARMVDSTLSLMSMGVSGIAAISLLVGGIGIMNVMLVSVTERTREIGIRLAIGARARDVALQFLVEAVVLAVAGGIAGAVLGLGAAAAITNALGVPFAISGEVVALAFGFSAGVGIVFGFFPALRAARLDPIDALRFE